MAMSGESIRAQALRCACMVVDPGASEDKIIAMASRFESWIAAGAALTPSGATRGVKPTSPLDLPLTPGEEAVIAAQSKEKAPAKRPKGQPAHQPPCYPGVCPACDMARSRGEI